MHRRASLGVAFVRSPGRVCLVRGANPPMMASVLSYAERFTVTRRSPTAGAGYCTDALCILCAALYPEAI